MRQLEVQSTEHRGKKRRLEPPTSNPIDSDPMNVDGEGQPVNADPTISNATTTPPWDDGTYRVG
ncbi:hypothetical protein PM082_018338 [Marasmius tenuissimus]|nr:hypothetical protein PM082_018338 [Marasmius tenuissimus]